MKRFILYGEMADLFCKEIEEKLISNDIDIAVHSLKDMESVENDKLTIGAYIKRNDFRDVIISKKIKDKEDLIERHPEIKELSQPEIILWLYEKYGNDIYELISSLYFL